MPGIKNSIQKFFPRQIFLVLSLAIFLNILRIVLFHSTYFTYLLWNLFLAVLPLVISSILLEHVHKNKLTREFLILSGLLWLLLFPNAPYIVTDLIHIGHGRSGPILFDTFLLFSSAWAGLLLGFASLNQMEQVFRMRSSKRTTAICIAGILAVTSFGMYLGRFLRFNSWDVFYNPLSLFDNISSIFTNPMGSSNIYIFTIVSFIFMYTGYCAYKEKR